MATSGSVDYNRTRDQIINGALRLCNVSGRGKAASADDIADASEALELMVKGLQKNGPFLWKKKEATVFIDQVSQSYLLGPTGGHATSSYQETTLSVAGAAAAGTVTVTTVTGIASGDYIGIELDNDTMQWTTVNGAPAGSVLTLTAALTSAAAVGSTVYTYTTKMPRPLKILETDEATVRIVSNEEYTSLSSKDATGPVNQLHYRPTLTNGTLFVWPVGETATDKIKITYQSPVEDFDSASNDPDFPQEWIETLKFLLASRYGPEVPINLKRQEWLTSVAESMLQDLLDWNGEDGSIFFGVDNG